MGGKQYIWFDGKYTNFKDAKVHVLTHSLQYGSGIFEGIRAYKAKDGTAIFRLREHVKRLFRTAKIYNMPLDFTTKEVENAVINILKKNALPSAYIRPFVFYNDTAIGLGVHGKKTSLIIAAVPFGNYFAGKDKGISCKVSSWQRINSRILPPEAKASGNYLNSILASTEARLSGADEAILTSMNGFVAEGSGENIFMVEDNELITPPKDSDILLGVTRDSIIKIAEYMGIVVHERNIHKEELYTCDEAFFVGTAAEVTPIIKIDGRKVGTGKPGPLTKVVANTFSNVVAGKRPEFRDWLTYV